MHYRQANESESFSNLLFPDNRFIKPGFYYSELAPYFEVFERNKIKIFLF